MKRMQPDLKPMPILAFLLVSFLLIFSVSAQNDNVDDTPCCCQGLAGNVNSNSLDNVNILDLTFIVDLIFRGGGQPLCPREGDVNGDGNEDTNILDLTALVDYIFRGGSGPANCIQAAHPVHQLGEDGEIICDVDFGPPCISLYILPFQVGNTFSLLGSNCAPVGEHVNWFAYDFDTQMGDTIIASRAGTVIVSNDQYPDDDFTCGHENNVFIFLVAFTIENCLATARITGTISPQICHTIDFTRITVPQGNAVLGFGMTCHKTVVINAANSQTATAIRIL